MKFKMLLSKIFNEIFNDNSIFIVHFCAYLCSSFILSFSFQDKTTLLLSIDPISSKFYELIIHADYFYSLSVFDSLIIVPLVFLICFKPLIFSLSMVSSFLPFSLIWSATCSSCIIYFSLPIKLIILIVFFYVSFIFPLIWQRNLAITTFIMIQII